LVNKYVITLPKIPNMATAIVVSMREMSPYLIVNEFPSNYNRIIDLMKNLRYYRLRAKGAKI